MKNFSIIKKSTRPALCSLVIALVFAPGVILRAQQASGEAETRKFTFTIPAPRGLILDRNGKVLAQNKVVNDVAIQFPKWGDEPDDARLLRFAEDRIERTIERVNDLLNSERDVSGEVIRKHYRNRRWMPLYLPTPLTKEESEKLSAAGLEGVQLIPVTLRDYPNGKMLSHVIGYTGTRPPRATGEITPDEPAWPVATGSRGLEKSFDQELTGTPGRISRTWDGKGNLIAETVLAEPRPGNSIVTSIDRDMQRAAEETLGREKRRGAVVVTDVHNGDVLAMASYPQYDPNDFIPSISMEKYKELIDNQEKPLFARAFQGTYPPASTFKVVSALSFLDGGHITPSETYPCPPSSTIGSLTLTNRNALPDGDMNVVSALARSCDTWFYEIATRAGADAMSSMATQLGLGEKTGLPLRENAGFIPTNRHWEDKYGHRLNDRHDALISVGRGHVQTTPVQIARMMAAIANGEHAYNARLVMRIEDAEQKAVRDFPPAIRNRIQVGKEALAAVREGMFNTVNTPDGDGKLGAHPITVAAKTGSTLWAPSKKQDIAWFAGYFPAANPVYSFAVVCEGEADEKVTGGTTAAPIFSSFLKQYLTAERAAAIKARSAETGEQ